MFHLCLPTYLSIFFLTSKGQILASSDCRNLIMEYVKKHQLADQMNKKFVVMDPLLTDVLFRKGEHEEKLTWDRLVNKYISFIIVV